MRELVQLRRARERVEARQRVPAFVRNPPSPEAVALAHARHRGRGPALALTLVASVAVHVGVLIFGWLQVDHGKKKEPEVKIEVRERKPPEPPPPLPPPEPVKAEPPPPAPEPPKKVASAKPPPPKPSEPPPPAAPKRVVGLSLESTTEGGEGPGFAVGNTTMGQTDTKAVDPKSVGQAPAPDAPAPPDAPPGPNRAATRVPGQGTVVRVPKRVAEVKPTYPELLRAQGLEADVVLLVHIDASGQVTSVKVITSSGQSDFDAAAVAAARTERYEPATKDGIPFPYDLKYTVRFRLDTP
jgi:periplasmic protein TonB